MKIEKLVMELKKQLDKQAKDYPILMRYPKEHLYGMLSGMATKEGLPLTVDNLMSQAPMLESDLYQMFRS